MILNLAPYHAQVTRLKVLGVVAPLFSLVCFDALSTGLKVLTDMRQTDLLIKSNAQNSKP